MISRTLVMLLLLGSALPLGAREAGCAARSPAQARPTPQSWAASVASAGASQPAAGSGRDSTRRRVARAYRPDTALVQLGQGAGGTRAFVAYPPGQGSAPAVIVVHEWWGLNGQIRELARRLAQQGYVAIVPDLYHGKVAEDPESAHVLARGLDEDTAIEDLSAAVTWLASEPRSAKRRRGVIGFCMGGHLALLSAFRDPTLSAVVMFYGTPESRPDRLALLHSPLLGHFGADDQGIDTTRVEGFRRALEGAGKSAEVYVYPNAGHAFMNEEQESYRPEPAHLAWVRTLDFLQKNLKASP